MTESYVKKLIQIILHYRINNICIYLILLILYNKTGM